MSGARDPSPYSPAKCSCERPWSPSPGSPANLLFAAQPDDCPHQEQDDERWEQPEKPVASTHVRDQRAKHDDREIGRSNGGVTTDEQPDTADDLQGTYDKPEPGRIAKMLEAFDDLRSSEQHGAAGK